MPVIPQHVIEFRPKGGEKKLAQVTYLSRVPDMHQQPCLDEEKINERFLEGEEVKKTHQCTCLA